MGGLCGTKEGEVQTGFWWGDVRERDPLEGLSLDGGIILTVQSLAVSLRTKRFNIRKFYMVLALR